MRYTLKKSEILRGKKNFQKLFSSGTKIYKNFITCIYLTEKIESKEKKILVGFTVNRKIKRAIIRNRCKRLMRESYRLNKHILDTETKNTYNISIIFYFKQIIEDEKIKYQQISEEIVDTLLLIRDEIIRKDTI